LFAICLSTCYVFFCIYRKKNKLNISEFYKVSITFRTNIMHTPTNFDQTDRSGTAPALRYDGAGPLTGIPSRNDIVAEFDNGMTAILQQSLSGKQPIHFMPTEVSDDTSEYVNGISSYILRITGTLINGQKAVVKITGIKPFFDVEVPEEMPLSTFKTRLVNILSNTFKGTSKFGIEHISAYPLQGY